MRSNHAHFKPHPSLLIHCIETQNNFMLSLKWILVAGETVFNFCTTRARLRASTSDRLYHYNQTYHCNTYTCICHVPQACQLSHKEWSLVLSLLIIVLISLASCLSHNLLQAKVDHAVLCLYTSTRQAIIICTLSLTQEKHPDQ